ncbi:type II secretion system F family protein [Methylobacillus sp. Pita2]|uniref:type II secretion system F family protein n=1 Tax=Methylobacillus sp. Pita2 TaxID=3383245 RepID=UPI0038B539B3
MSFGLNLALFNFRSKRADFYYDLAKAMDDQSDLVSEFSNLRKRATERGQKGRAQMYAKWIEGLDSGSLSNALKGDVPETDLMIISAFETSGRLAEGLKFLSKTIRTAQKMKSSMIMALAGPIFALGLGIMVLALMSFILMPIMVQIYPVEEWPLSGRILYPISQIVANYGIYIGVIIVLAIVGFGLSIKRWYGDKRVVVDNWIGYSMFRDYNGAMFLTSLAALMKAGTGIMEALVKLQEMSTPWMQWHIRKMIKGLDSRAGEPAEALDTGSLPEEVMDRIADYGKRSSFLEAMNMIGLESMERTEAKIAKSAQTINMLMLFMVGILFVTIIVGTVQTGMHAQTVIRAKMV